MDEILIFLPPVFNVLFILSARLFGKSFEYHGKTKEIFFEFILKRRV
jgi:hypothetical protein